MAKGKSLLLLGASGLIGGECLGFLRDDDYYTDVTVLTRTSLPGGDLPSGLKQYVIDFDRIDRHRELVRADDVVCALGSTRSRAGSRENFYRIDFGYPYELAKTAVENGAGRFFLVSAMGADSRSFFFYNRVKGELEGNHRPPGIRKRRNLPSLPSPGKKAGIPPRRGFVEGDPHAPGLRPARKIQTGPGQGRGRSDMADDPQ